MTALFLFVASLFAATCNLDSINSETVVNVYYQKQQQAGDIKVTHASDPITVSGSVDPKEVDMDGLKIHRPNEKITVSTAVPLDTYNIVPGSLKFEVAEVKGRIEGDPKVTYDRDQSLANVTITLKYADGKFESQDVSATGIVKFDTVESVREPIWLEPALAYKANLDFKTALIVPEKEGDNLLSPLNRPDRIVIKDEEGCVWYEGGFYSAIPFMGDETKSYISLQGRPLQIHPTESDKRLILEVVEK